MSVGNVARVTAILAALVAAAGSASSTSSGSQHQAAAPNGPGGPNGAYGQGDPNAGPNGQGGAYGQADPNGQGDPNGPNGQAGPNGPQAMGAPGGPDAQNNPPPAQQMDPQHALGLWRSTFGAVKIEPDNSHGGLAAGSVQGIWLYQRRGQEVVGYFAGSLRGNVLQFRWQEPGDAPLTGDGFLVFDRQGRQYTGRWWSDRRDRVGDWNGWRQPGGHTQAGHPGGGDAGDGGAGDPQPQQPRLSPSKRTQSSQPAQPQPAREPTYN